MTTFKPTTKRIEKLAELFPDAVKELEELFFKGNINVYIDWANVIHWQERLGWHISLKRLKQLLDSFNTVKTIRLYTGTLEGNEKSETSITELEDAGYKVTTKPVKFFHLPRPLAASVRVFMIHYALYGISRI